MGHVVKYLGHQISDPIKLSLNPFNSNNWRTEAKDAFNTDPGDIVRDNAGDKAANTLHQIVSTVAPAIVGMTPLGPLGAAATKAGFNYADGGSLGSSIGKGALTYGTSVAGNYLGNLASAGNSAGAFGGGTGGAGSAYGSGAVGSYSDITDAGINGIGSQIGSGSSALGSGASGVASGAGNAGTFASDLASNAGNITSTVGSNVGNSGSLLGSLAQYGKYATPIVSAGLGTYTNLAAKNDLLDAQKKNQQLLEPFLNRTFTPGDLTQDPGYQFQLSQGNKALDRQQAAKGNFFSGQALQDAQTFGQGLAGTTYNDAFNRYLQNNGQQLQAAGGLVDSNTTVGNAKANSITGLGNLLSGTAGSLLGGTALGNTGSLLGQSAYSNSNPYAGLNNAQLQALRQQNLLS